MRICRIMYLYDQLRLFELTINKSDNSVLIQLRASQLDVV